MEHRALQVLFFCLVTASLGVNCAGQGDAMLPVAIPDGAYGGPVLTIVSSATAGGTVVPEVTTSGYRVVEISGGAIRGVRIAPDKNGPFGCWLVSPGSARTIALSLGGLDGNQVQTILETSALSFHFGVTFTAVGMQQTTTVTGQGSFSGIIDNDLLKWAEEQELSGAIGSLRLSTTGTLARIGDIGALPPLDGLNGLWLNTYPNGGSEGFEIRGLRVINYYDSPIAQPVTISQPVVGSTSVGGNVFISFTATTSFQSDPTPRSYAITFRGTVQADGRILGTTTSVASGVADKVFDTTLERVSSDPC